MAESHADEVTLLAYVDDELQDDERQALERHLETCPTCAVEARRLESGRDALRGSPRLELSEERRHAIVASLPARKEAWSFLAPLRRLGPALPAAAVLLLVAAFVALATQLPGGGDGDETAGEAGMAAEESAEDRAGGGDTTGAPEAEKDEGEGLEPAQALTSGEPVARVEGPPGEVVRLLRENGHAAFVRDGSVVAVGDEREIRSQLAGRPRGPVRVFARSP
ncbi:MAG: anti-sigma factor family protein [Gaiellaceae bacterium]